MRIARAFDARVVACDPRPAAGDSPAGYAVELDATAFYPTSGGQPFDTGTLGGARVLDVVDDDERIVHVLDAALTPGDAVSGAIDWPRRFEHMQQHTGQHVLSAAFERVCANRTESFHLGSESCSIDLAREVSARDVAAVVDEANRIVWEDRPVVVRFVTAEEAAALPLRKEPARAGTLRLIDVEDYDLSACGGTHVARTGGIGIIVVSGWEKFRGGSRVQFLCGVRVQRRFDLWRDALAATMKHLSVAPDELAAGVERLQGEGKTLQRALAAGKRQAGRLRGARTGRARHARGSPPGDCRGAARPGCGGVEGDGCGGGHVSPERPWRCSQRRRRHWSSWRAMRPPASTRVRP